jgi:hypothetical protein
MLTVWGMQSLSDTKDRAQEMHLAIESANQTAASLQDSCSEYTAVAVRACLLFFAIQDMAVLSPLYKVGMMQHLHCIRLSSPIYMSLVWHQKFEEIACMTHVDAHARVLLMNQHCCWAVTDMLPPLLLGRD